ncbi:MAG: hypothetical protein KJZ77_05155 [Anaerolineales bacterium]|nr:hypothetical protein [Anaerolineales bacterium]
MKHKSFLARNQVFFQLDTDELKQLQAQAKIRQFQGGEWIAYHGDVWPNLFLILKGQVTAAAFCIVLQSREKSKLITRNSYS